MKLSEIGFLIFFAAIPVSCYVGYRTTNLSSDLAAVYARINSPRIACPNDEKIVRDRAAGITLMESDRTPSHINIEKAYAENKLSKGNMVYLVPDSMKAKTPTKVFLTISRNISLEYLKHYLKIDSRNFINETTDITAYGGTSGLVSKEILVSGKMTAHLYTMDSTAFRISRASEQEQLLSLDGTDAIQTKWEWSVTPLKPGNHQIMLKVSASIAEEGNKRPLVLEVYNGVIPVTAIPSTQSETIISFLGYNMSILYMIFGGMFLLYTSILILGPAKQDQRPGHQKNNTTWDPY